MYDYNPDGLSAQELAEQVLDQEELAAYRRETGWHRHHEVYLGFIPYPNPGEDVRP